MESLSKAEVAFLEALGQIHANWVASVGDAAAIPGQDLSWSEDPASFQRVAHAINAAALAPEVRSVLSQLAAGILHSVLVCLDGAANYPGTDTLQLTTEGRSAFRRHLHEYFFPYVKLPPYNT